MNAHERRTEKRAFVAALPVYFHDLSDAQFERLKKQGFTWAEAGTRMLPPTWCGYPGALEGIMGCWSLVGNMVTGEEYCADCDCHRAALAGAGESK